MNFSSSSKFRFSSFFFFFSKKGKEEKKEGKVSILESDATPTSETFSVNQFLPFFDLGVMNDLKVVLMGTPVYLQLGTEIWIHPNGEMGFPGASNVKESTSNAGGLGSISGLGRSLEKGMATHSSILASRISMDREA